MKHLFTLGFFVFSFAGIAQNLSKRTLFLGNSYTYVNNLPQMLADVATSTNDTLVFDSNTIGGYTLSDHSTDVNSLNKIAAGNWDYVVLQEQSQLPSFPIGQVQTEVFPYAEFLDSVINADNICAETVFYMTWGRKNGDASNCSGWSPVCTYEGMDSLLNLRYRMMAQDNQAVLSPVGAVWHFIRDNFPLIELYQGDESHPTVAGTYAAACCFYATLFRKDPALISYNPSLPVSDAQNIRNAAKTVVYDSLINWHIGEYDPAASFNYTGSGVNELTFNNSSGNSSFYFWDFGDGTTSEDENPVHVFPAPGNYDVTLISGDCGLTDTVTQTVTISSTGVELHEINAVKIYPNPLNSMLYIELQFQESTNYKFRDTQGRELISGVWNNLKNYMDVSFLADGIYLLELSNNKGFVGSYKLIKTRE